MKKLRLHLSMSFVGLFAFFLSNLASAQILKELLDEVDLLQKNQLVEGKSDLFKEEIHTKCRQIKNIYSQGDDKNSGVNQLLNHQGSLYFQTLDAFIEYNRPLIEVKLAAAYRKIFSENKRENSDEREKTFQNFRKLKIENWLDFNFNLASAGSSVDALIRDSKNIQKIISENKTIHPQFNQKYFDNLYSKFNNFKKENRYPYAAVLKSALEYEIGVSCVLQLEHKVKTRYPPMSLNMSLNQVSAANDPCNSHAVDFWWSIISKHFDSFISNGIFFLLTPEEISVEQLNRLRHSRFFPIALPLVKDGYTRTFDGFKDDSLYSFFLHDFAHFNEREVLGKIQEAPAFTNTLFPPELRRVQMIRNLEGGPDAYIKNPDQSITEEQIDLAATGYTDVFLDKIRRHLEGIQKSEDQLTQNYERFIDQQVEKICKNSEITSNEKLLNLTLMQILIFDLVHEGYDEFAGFSDRYGGRIPVSLQPKNLIQGIEGILGLRRDFLEGDLNCKDMTDKSMILKNWESAESQLLSMTGLVLYSDTTSDYFRLVARLSKIPMSKSEVGKSEQTNDLFELLDPSIQSQFLKPGDADFQIERALLRLRSELQQQID